MMTSEAPDVFNALFGPLPEGWRERKGLPPEATPQAEDSQQDAKTAEANRAPPPRFAGAPQSPWHLGRSSWMAILKRTASEFSKDRVTSVAGGVTFFALLALFPAITALVSIYGRMADPETISQNLALLNQFLPSSAIDLIAGQVTAIASAPQGALSLAGIVALLAALWSANGGTKALIDALNIAWFENESRGFIKLNLVSLGLTLGGIIGIVLLLALIAVLPAILDAVFVGGGAETIIRLLRWPLIGGLVLLGLAVIYRFGPNKKDPAWQWISPGAVVATLGLLIASALFSWYASNLANYNETYGSLGAAIAMMMWLWIAAIVVLMGAELNAEVERQIKIENGVEPKDETDLQKR
ncbi:YihY/virulence factor BrkB family protein [Paracoccus contaminans]|uniref:Uncharacterized protein n=1 Tax=Paracoccus contaminans TaxID=1945662 RepID=A0A1W6CUR8_9RHOB|nr:YihY/virulence factor BrkB family protein [Paracoccus contaminans]ARJ68607.1 hypothetical protein B0A89_02070 [Paracoccus contaminans]